MALAPVKYPLSLVLGSGGARGLCFFGALRALEEAGLEVAHVVGSSMGALVGAGYCSGRSPMDLARSIHDFSWRRILRPDPLGPGLFEPSGLMITASGLIDANTLQICVSLSRSFALISKRVRPCVFATAY